MRCTSPRTVGFKDDGKTISWSPKQYSKEYATFQLPCGKCIECRLDYARQWAIRCVHEAQMHKNNVFLTLTYSDENLKSPKLIYADFQKFMKKLRKTQDTPMGVFVTGEYGEKNKRPHWHAIIFNYYPPDSLYAYTNARGDKLHTSTQIDKLWPHGKHDFGEVTMQSAGYVARYAAKKLVHGNDGEHEYEPISKKSSKHAIGKRWLEKYYADVFNTGRLVLADGTSVGIPRYYEKWLKENKPQDWIRYVTDVKLDKIALASAKQKITKDNHQEETHRRLDIDPFRSFPLTDDERRALIQEQKFKQLQDYLKL